MTKDLGGAEVYLQREGSDTLTYHHINNVSGPGPPGKEMGNRASSRRQAPDITAWRPPRDARDGPGNVKSSMVREDPERQALERLPDGAFGLHSSSVTTGTQTQKDAVKRNEPEWGLPHRRTNSCWVLHGAAPLPPIVRDFQRVTAR
jgi:tryptophan synthase beta chain